MCMLAVQSLLLGERDLKVLLASSLIWVKVVGSSNESRAIEVEGFLFGSISNECK